MSVSLSMVLGALWVVAAAIVAGLPYRHQFPPGIVLLILAPFLIGFISWQHGVIWLGIALFAFVSMFRRPLFYLTRKALGLHPDRPDRGAKGGEAE